MILSCTGLDQATISGLSMPSTVMSALHTSLAAFHAKMYIFFGMSILPQERRFLVYLAVFGCTMVPRYMVMFEAHTMVSTVNSTGIDCKQPTMHLQL